MNHLALKQRLSRYPQTYYSERFIASGELQRIVAASTSYSPQNVGRRLRELENEGLIEVKHLRNRAHYRFKVARPTFA